MLIRRSLLLLVALVACQTPEPYVAPPVVAGVPQAGAAEGTIDLPIGVPMGGYSARSHLLGSASKPDNRASAYTVGFVESGGIHTRPEVKTVWLHNGDDHLVIIKVDLIYSNDMLVEDVTAELEARTGQDLQGRVVISASHSHQSWGPFSDQFHFYLGGDKFNPEIYARLVQQVAQTSEAAWDDRQDVAIGTAWARDWDPDDRVYRDRRGVNDALQVWDDLPAGYGKDPHLNMIRVDALDGSPIAMMFTFGMHGTAVGEDSAMVSTDAPGGVEMAVREQFDEQVVVMHLQGSGGDASPAGSGERFERLENVGLRAVGPIMDLWERTPTSDAPISMESASRHIPEFRDQIRVTRDGQVDWSYAPMGTIADGEIYDSNGDLLAPIDEFNAPYGAAFCGADEPLIPAGGIGAQVFPYDSCVDAGLVSRILYAIFDIEDGEISLPMPSSLKAGSTTSLIGPLVTLTPGGEQVDRPLYMGFFPGEPTAMYGEQFRRRAEAELGHPMALTVGYAQDHEGYLLIPEDWLMGGYEPNIALWGPLQGEHIMEGMLDYSAMFLGNGVHDDTAVGQLFTPTKYLDRPLPEIVPDLTPDAGTPVSSIPMDRFYMPNDMTLDLQAREQIPRVQGIVQLAWLGGDTMVDLPVVTLQRAGRDSYEPVTTRSGRVVTDAMTDMLMTHRPEPLYPVDALQQHYYWAAWQAVGHFQDRASLPLGTYRLHVQGKRWIGGDSSWPWTTEDYSFDGEPFEIVPGEITVQRGDGSLFLSLEGPPDGWRMVHAQGRASEHNPVVGPVWVSVDGAQRVQVEVDSISSGRSVVKLADSEARLIEVWDAAENYGALSR